MLSRSMASLGTSSPWIASPWTSEHKRAPRLRGEVAEAMAVAVAVAVAAVADVVQRALRTVQWISWTS